MKRTAITAAAAILVALSLAGCGRAWVTDHATGMVYETTDGDLIGEAATYWGGPASFTDTATGETVTLTRGYTVHGNDPRSDQ